MNDASGSRRQHHAQGAGRWFPAEPVVLRRMVEGFIEAARPTGVKGRIVAAIAPHAGFVYSGTVAGYTYRALRDNAAREGAPDTVVVLGFAHRGAGRGVAWLDGQALQTPLGPAALDAELTATLAAADDCMQLDAGPHRSEHSAENQVPFLQVALPDTRLAIAIVRAHDPATLAALRQALEHVKDTRRIVVLASTDLLHDPDWERVRRTDTDTLRIMASLDDDTLAARWRPDRQVCCGIGPVLTAMRYARERGSRAGTLLRYRNSGDDFPESRGEWVVGYGALVYAVA